MEVETKDMEDECKDGFDYLQKLSLCNEQWWEGSDECDWIFRGQYDSQQELLPSLYRKNNKIDRQIYAELFSKLNSELIKSIPEMGKAITYDIDRLFNAEDEYGNMLQNRPDSDVFKERLSNIIQSRMVELKICEDFLLSCNKIGLKIPSVKLFKEQLEYSHAVDHFYRNLSERDFNDNNPIYQFTKNTLSTGVMFGFPLFCFDYPNTIALARHHRIANRFLDWTTDPLIAAFFSAYDFSGENNNLRENQKMCVWALNKKCIYSDKMSFHENLLQEGLEFLRCQKGLFTVMTGYDSYYLLKGKWPTVEEYLQTPYGHQENQNQNQDCIRKIEIDVKYAPEIIEKLARMGVEMPSLMPTYDNVAKELLRRYQV